MPDSAIPRSFVIDASVASKLHFFEAGTDEAGAAVRGADRIIAPELLYLEMANIAAKKARRGTSSREEATRAVNAIGALLEKAVSLSELAPRAFELAVTHGFSAYDGAYLALAELSDLPLLTADLKLARLARQVGLGDLVQTLEGGS